MGQVAEEYIVLRNLAASSTAEPFSGRSGTRSLPGDPVPFQDVPAEPHIESLDLSPSDVREVARQGDVMAVARRMATSLIQPTLAEAEDEVETDAWGIETVKANLSSATGEGVVVAILDTGIDANHAAFAGVDIIQQDFTGDGPTDVNGHGTHCAGTIFGRDVNNRRIGIARGVRKALIGKVLQNRSGTSKMIFDGLNWASSQNANIISMSLGFDFGKTVEDFIEDGFPVKVATSRALESYRANMRMFDALMAMIQARQAFGGGSLVIAAAGNESTAEIDPRFTVSASLPAAALHVIAVSALQRGGQGLTMWPHSNINPQLSAPGHKILSARSGTAAGLTLMSGTSMACPHVAGVAALWWEWLRRSDIMPAPQMVSARLLASAVTNGFAPGVASSDRGFGLVTAPDAS